jgi:hypothetical protein
MQFTIGVTVLECSFVKHSHGPLGVKWCTLLLELLPIRDPTRAHTYNQA